MGIFSLSPPRDIKDGKMARFGFCAALSLNWGNGGLLFYFILSEIVAQILETLREGAY